jgi:hypothetical protein
MKVTTLLAIAVMVPAGLLAAGCSGSAAAHPDPVTTLRPPGGGAVSVSLPLDAYQTDASQQAALNQAIQELVATCMRAKGFTMPPETSIQKFAQALSEQDAAATANGVAGPYGLTSMSVASKYGYGAHLPPGFSPPAHPIRPKGNVINIGPTGSPAFELALTGYTTSTPPAGSTIGGCQGKSDSAIYSHTVSAKLGNLVGQLEAQSLTETENNPAVVRVLAKWSSCMTAKGFSYTTPMQAAGAKWPLLDPTPKEIATAEADVSCKEKTNLALVWTRIEAGYQRTLINQNTTALQQEAQDQATQVNRAEAVLRKGGTNGS